MRLSSGKLVLGEQVWSGAWLNSQHPDPSLTHLGCWALEGTMNARDLQGDRVHFADGDPQEQGGVNTCQLHVGEIEVESEPKPGAPGGGPGWGVFLVHWSSYSTVAGS